ncbi:MAG: hypothetical protein PHQ12_07775 [Chthoniobacteraceae bacterium]|nr:hypothetical protein [Chthoniobacteraceae bacterium]
MKTLFFHALLFVCLCTAAFAQAGRIYTAPDPAATGGLEGSVAEPLSHAIAVERDRTRVFLAALNADGTAFRFEHLPVGKYDLVLFSRAGTVYEGLALGDSPAFSAASAKHLEERVAASDGFFNRYRIHRTGVSADGETALAFVERFRANNVLKQSGEALGQMVRRFEIAELTSASDDWQLTASRHLYREGEPILPQFRSTVHVPDLGGVRVISTLRAMGPVALPKNP